MAEWIVVQCDVCGYQEQCQHGVPISWLKVEYFNLCPNHNVELVVDGKLMKTLRVVREQAPSKS